MIHPHKILHGDRKACLDLVPFAKHKLRQLRKFMDRKGLSSFHQRHAAPEDGSILLICTRTESIIHIWAGIDGYYSLGNLEDSAGEYYISGSRTARGVFGDRGIFAGGAFTVPNLFYVGDGFGVVPESGGSNTVILHRTRDAKRFEVLIQFSFSADSISGGGSIMVAGGRGISEDPFLERSFGVLVRGYFESTDDYAAVYFYTLDGGSSWGQADSGYGSAAEVGMGTMRRVGPRNLIKFIPTYANTRNGNTRGMSYFGVSEDNGVNWSFPGGNDLLTEIEATTGSLSSQAYNDLLARVAERMNMIRLVTGDTMMCAWWDDPEGDNEDIRVYRAPGAGAAFSRVATIPDSQVLPATSQELNADLCQGVPLIQPFVRDDEASALLFVGNENATAWTQRTLPWTARHVGYVKAINRERIVLPAFNTATGHHELFESADLGQNWEYRATIRTDTIVPTPRDQTVTVLPRFGILSILRQNGRAAPTFPGQPWVGDYRITPPWEA